MKNFFDMKDEKISERAFSRSIAISLLSILLCLVLLCSVTYAWFTTETMSSCNTLQSGTFGVTASAVQTAGDDLDTSEIKATPIEGQENLLRCELPRKGTYTVTLTMTDASTVKGHCVVIVGEESPKNTATILNANCKNCENRPHTDPFSFTLSVTEPTTVVIEPRWGEVANPDIYGIGTASESDSVDSESGQSTEGAG